MKHIGITFACFFLQDCLPCSAAEPPRLIDQAKPDHAMAREALREASEIALKQEGRRGLWIERGLVRIAELQTRIRDFDGALRTIRGSNDSYESDNSLFELAKALAREGKVVRAFEVLNKSDSKKPSRRDYREDCVQLQWMEYLVVSGDLGRAGQAFEKLKNDESRSEALRKLAVGHARSGNAVQSLEHFNRAIEAAALLKEDSDRAKALWKPADAQLTVGAIDAAKATIRRFAESPDIKDPWTRLWSLTEYALVAARMSDKESAIRLFNQAIEALQSVDSLNLSNAVRVIVEAQAKAGYVEETRNTVSKFKSQLHDEFEDRDHAQALVAIGAAQLKAGDVAGAVSMAMSIKRYLQYRDDILREVVGYQIRKRDFKGALANAEKIENQSRKAAAIFNVATGHAKARSCEKAIEVATRIELTKVELLPLRARDCKEDFDYRNPAGWGIAYDGPGFSMSSHFSSLERAGEVAASAMTLWQALGHKPAQSFAAFFNDTDPEYVTRALARAHAATGDTKEALAWAKRIGSDDKTKLEEDDQTLAVERRIHALIGVAEGILERSGDLPPKVWD